MNYLIKHYCKYCYSSNETISNGYVVCTSCGTTKEREYVDYKASLSKEGIMKNKQDSIGKSIDFIGALGSQIGYSSGYMTNSNKKRLKPSIVAKYKRLKVNYHDKARLNGNATHLRTMIAFNKVFNSLSISKDVKYRALFLYWQHVNSGIRITNHVLLIALCLLQSIREANERAPIRFSEVVNSFNSYGHRVTNKNILRLARELKVPLSPNRRLPKDYIERIASKLRDSDSVKRRLNNEYLSLGEYEMLVIIVSKKFLNLISRKQRGGVQPYPFAVSIIYLADRAISKAIRKKPVLTQQILAKIADSAEFTIRDHVYRFLGNLYTDVEDKLIKTCTDHINKRINN